MAWFSRQDIEAKLKAAEDENATLRADLEAAQQSLQDAGNATQELASAREELESAQSAIRDEETAHAATKQSLADALAAVEPSAVAARINAAIGSEDESDEPIRAAIEAEVTNRIVAGGHKPVNTAQADNEEQTKTTLSREAFRNLKSHEQNKFIRDGGKLTE